MRFAIPTRFSATLKFQIAFTAAIALIGLCLGLVTWPLGSHFFGKTDAGAQAAVVKQLEAVTVVSERPTVTGYDRDLFGSWTGPPECNTRKQVLEAWFQATDCSLHDAHVIADPYGNGQVGAHEVDIDHVFPLAAAWDFGASRWDSASRQEFANDIESNLVPTRSSINREKSDSTPDEWLPAPETQCDYAQKYLAVALKWNLAVSIDDWKALAQACDIKAM